MDEFNYKRQRKQQRQSKVSDDESNHSTAPNNKRQRRGVSVFQRQLYKRKVWVKEYEAGKDQKRRDKRKVMRGYYRALKDLDREHKQIFGKSISTKKYKKNNQKRKTHPNDYDNHNDKLNHHRKDVWHELRHPSYQQNYNKSNWNFIDTKKYKNNNQQRPISNKRYKGT
eukprot:361687_1